MSMTEFIQNEAQEFLKDNHCDICLICLDDAYDTDRWGCVEVYGVYEKSGDLIGFKCPECENKSSEDINGVIE